MTWRRYALILPIPLVMWQPANRLIESWWHYGFSMGYGPFRIQLTRPAREQLAELMVDTAPVEPGDTVAGYAVTSGFGPRVSPCPGCSSNHGGVDLATPVGTPLHAPQAVEVSCFWDSGGGGLVADIWLGVENYKALHLDTCEDGTYAAGEVFATTGNTGNGTGPHLDWRQKVNGEWVKPTKGVLESALSGQPLQPSAPLTALSDETLFCAIGAAEGTLSDDCAPNHNYFGHRDPGNGVTNLGAFSYQHGASSPAEADQKQLQRLRNAEKAIQAQAVGKFGQPLSTAALAAALDLWNQAPKAGQDFVTHLATFDPSPQQIVAARSQSFIDPATGALDAPGLGNDMSRVQYDQTRRTNELLEQLK